MMSTKECEFCNKKLKNESQETVCGPCDKQLKVFEIAERRRAKAHAAKFKCIVCCKPLTLDKRKFCSFCHEVISNNYNDVDNAYAFHASKSDTVRKYKVA